MLSQFLTTNSAIFRQVSQSGLIIGIYVRACVSKCIYVDIYRHLFTFANCRQTFIKLLTNICSKYKPQQSVTFCQFFSLKVMLAWRYDVISRRQRYRRNKPLVPYIYSSRMRTWLTSNGNFYE